MNVGSLLVADPKSAKLVQPGERPFHDPTPTPQTAAVLDVTHCKKRHNAAFTQTLPD